MERKEAFYGLKAVIMDFQRLNYKNAQFLNVTNPRDSVLKKLITAYGFNPLDLEDIANKTQVSKIESYQNYSLIVLDFPVYTTAKNYIDNLGYEQKAPPKKVRLKFVKSTISNLLTLPATALSYTFPSQDLPKEKRIFHSQVYFFIGKDFFVIIHDNELPIINEIFELCEKNENYKEDWMGKGPTFFAYRIVDALVDLSFPIVNRISAKIEKIDRQLEISKSQDILEDISITRRNLVYFKTIVKPLVPLFKQLEEGKYEALNGEMTGYWSNVADHIRNLSERIEDNRELIEGISESNESLINSKNNEIIAFLTIMFTLSVPATVIGAFYGMNVLLPGGIESGPWDFWGPYTTFFVVIIASILPIILMALYFRWKRWL